MSYQPRPYADIAARRKAAILAGAPIIPKGACHYCDWRLAPRGLWCCVSCCEEYEAEKKELLGN